LSSPAESVFCASSRVVISIPGRVDLVPVLIIPRDEIIMPCPLLVISNKVLFPLSLCVACISLAFRGILGIKIGSFVYSSISNHVDTKISIFISPDGRHLNRGSCNTLIFTPKIPLHPSCISLYNHKLSGLCYHPLSLELCLWGSRAFEPL